MTTLTRATRTAKTLTVQDVEVPTFLYGTAWKEDRTEALVEKALASGFRGIDTANLKEAKALLQVPCEHLAPPRNVAMSVIRSLTIVLVIVAFVQVLARCR